MRIGFIRSPGRNPPRGLVFILAKMRRQFPPLSAPWVLLLLALPAAGHGQAAQALSGRDRIAAANEAVLDSLYAPLVYIMLESERGIYPGLQLAAKRDFLRMFWVKRDPTPGTPRNEAEDAFNERIAFVNKKFSEGGSMPVPGWRSSLMPLPISAPTCRSQLTIVILC